MPILDFQTAQDIVFSSQEMRRLLPAHSALFDFWLSSVQAPALRQIGRRAILDFLQNVTPEEMGMLSRHLGQDLSIDSPDHRIAKDVRCGCEELASTLAASDGYAHFAITRGKEEVKVCFWR